MRNTTDELKIILPASEIPDESFVTKVTGKKRYVLRHKITLYQNKSDPQVIQARDGAVFLVSDVGDITAHGGDKELIWVTSYDEFTHRYYYEKH